MENSDFVGILQKKYAKNLANIAIKIRDQVIKKLQSESPGKLILNIFKQFASMVPSLDIEQFADYFAQIISYTLFWVEAAQEQEFTLNNLVRLNPFLGIIFDAFIQFDENLDYWFEDLFRFLKKPEIRKVFHEIQQKQNDEDPIVYFYEHFLKAYNPMQKIERGVFYTPPPIVSFINKSIDNLLRTEFNCSNGLATQSEAPIINAHPIQVLDLATGTGTFLLNMIDKIKQEWEKNYPDQDSGERKKAWNQYVAHYLLPQLYGFELLMPPYIVAYLKLVLKLAKTGYDFESNNQLQLYLTNTLEGISYRESCRPELDNTVTIIVGNPPYQVNSKNTTPYIQELMKTYKADVKNEKYIKPLSDDYIKFIRLAHHLISITGFGIIGMVTNHGFLSGLIHRGMRSELLQFFDKFFILDLHGNINIKETCPDGSVDQNVFNIQQGVVIILFVKTLSKLPRPEVYHLDLWGKREYKYQFMLKNTVSTIPWNQIHPAPPNYFFFPHDTTLAPEYHSYLSIKEIFNLQRIGILTNRDWLVIDFSTNELKKKIERFFTSLERPELQTLFPQLAKTWWDYNQIKKLKVQTAINSITKCLFRPFDIRYIVYHPFLLNRARTEVMDHINGKKNLVLITSRHHRKAHFTSCFISNYIVEQKAGESTRGSYVFPLYYYSNGAKRSNLTSIAKKAFEGSIVGISEVSILSYIYAILYSAGYRLRYDPFLKLDFPRIPITRNRTLFEKLVNLGRELISLHLLDQNPLPEVKFVGIGDNLIKKGYPKFKNNSIFINDSQYFHGVTDESWGFIIGGYQVCHKWLKDRIGRTLSDPDLLSYRKIITAILKTIHLIRKIDDTIELHGDWPIQ